jgi:hypothetical protein
MSEFVTKSVAQEEQAHKIETRTALARIAGFALIATAMAALAVLGAAALFAQGQGKDKDKYSLVSPGGIAFSDGRSPSATRRSRYSFPQQSSNCEC